eukprot:5816788-Amphidinium_carterae.1
MALDELQQEAQSLGSNPGRKSERSYSAPQIYDSQFFCDPACKDEESTLQSSPLQAFSSSRPVQNGGGGSGNWAERERVLARLSNFRARRQQMRRSSQMGRSVTMVNASGKPLPHPLIVTSLDEVDQPAGDASPRGDRQLSDGANDSDRGCEQMSRLVSE